MAKVENMPDRFRVLGASITCALLGACAIGPNYTRPETATPSAYKELAGWQRAQPADSFARGAWWEIFGDADLNGLESQIEVSNQSLKQAEAQYRQASALVSNARAGFFPTLTGNASATRSDRYSNSGSTTTGGATPSHPSDSYSLPFTASWEPDLWGRVRRTVEGEVANAQASAATLESTRLSLHAQLAQVYFQLRTVDEQKRLLDDTVAAYQRSLQLTQNQYDVGVVARSDVIQAQAQLKSAQAQAIDLGVTRAQYEHALAVLVGKTPDAFSFSPRPLTLKPPAIPIDLPSNLLERRPDVAIAERQVAAANAQIGLAESAYFPSLALSATGGYQSNSFSQWLTAPSRFWSIGPQIAETIFNGGARKAQTAQARASWEAAVANYRQTALAAFQNVEDNIAALRQLEAEAAVQDEAVKDSEQALTIANNQYRAGTVSYLSVITAETTAYANERNAIGILGDRLNDSVALIKALGGGWDEKRLPPANAIGIHAATPDSHH